MAPDLPIHLTEATGVPLYRQIHDQIVAAVRAGALVDGDALPSIRVFSAELVVAAVTVRGAYDLLESEGLIVRQRGRGTFVCVTPAVLRQLGQVDAEADLRAAIGAAVRAGIDAQHVRQLVDDELTDDLEGR
jgi:GntR family transcriptional regulator